MQDTINRFLDPDRITTRDEVMTRPTPVPALGGVYGWWFRSLPAPIDTSKCLTRDGLTLLYVGISPTAPPANGRLASSQNLRIRIQTHFAGNAEGSTLRRTLGCLLATDLGIQLRRVGSGTRFTFLGGEQRLSAWMARNALVSWIPCERPWEVEAQLIATLDLPLNLEGNRRHAFHPALSRIRSDAIAEAKSMPVVPNLGIGGRHADSLADVTSRFVARVIASDTEVGREPLGRLVLTGSAATVDRRSVEDSRSMLATAFAALRRDGKGVDILATPAGLVDHKPGGEWHGLTGWDSRQGDADALAAVASSVAENLMTPELRALAQGVVGHLVLGIDVWPADQREPHGEFACLVDIETGVVRTVTGKSYPTPAQERDLIRYPDRASHVVQVGNERLAILVCHDLAAWHPRGNAAARGTRAEVWRAMQDAVTTAKPTLAVQLPHTVDKARTWTAAWALFGRAAGQTLRAATTAIRHLDHGYNAIPGPFDASLLGGTGWGERVVDVVISGRDEILVGMSGPAERRLSPPSGRLAPRRVSTTESATNGMGLARLALDVFRKRSESYPDGIRLAELLRELSLAGHSVGGNDPLVTLRSGLNGSQKFGLWVRHDGGVWFPGDGQSKMDAGISGRELAEALHRYVVEENPGGVFHYEKARVGLERTGVDVRGTGSTTRAALVAATDLFEHVPGRGGLWRWKNIDL